MKWASEEEAKQMLCPHMSSGQDFVYCQGSLCFCFGYYTTEWVYPSPNTSSATPIEVKQYRCTAGTT